MLQDGPIDVHSHVAPFDFPANPVPSESRWPCMVCGAAGKRSVTIAGKPFRELDERSWDTARRLDDMDRDGLAAQVLSPMPELLSYWFDAEASVAMCDHMNGTIATMVARQPRRFRGLGMAPIQHIDAALAMLGGMRRRFGLDGIEVGSNVDGAPIGDRRFDPIWAAAQDLGLAVFVHALHPLATRTVPAPAMLTPLAGFPLDVGLAAASLMMSGVITRFPRLRIALSHGGGALGAILGRLDAGWRLTNGFGQPGSELPSLQARRLFYDGNVYDGAYLAHLAAHVAPGQVFLGTDYPYDIQQVDPIAFVQTAGLAPEVLASLTRGAALRFLGQT